MIALRPDQVDLVERTRAAFARWRCVVMQAPCGSGKTTTACEILRRVVERENTAAFVARLTVLVEDTHARVTASGLRAGIVQAGRARDPSAPIQICSLDTLAARNAVPDAQLVILDECHAAGSPDVDRVLALWPRAKILGLSGTPQRSDGAPLTPFEHIVCGPQPRELQRLGIVVPPWIVSVPHTLATRTLAATPIDAYVEHTPQGRAIVFASSVAHAESIGDEARLRGIASITITGKSTREDRERARAMLTVGPSIVSSVQVFREGWDVPSADVAVIARGIDNVGAWIQTCSRAARAAPGKTHYTVLDLHGCHEQLGWPDEDHEWTLDGRNGRRVNPRPVFRCLECGSVHEETGPCPRCGAVATRTRKLPVVLTAAEKLARIEAIEDPAARARAKWSALCRQARAWNRHDPVKALRIATAQWRKRENCEPPR